MKPERIRQHFEDLGVQDGAEAEKMNASHQIQNDFPVHCVIYSFIGGKPDHLSDLPYAVLVVLIVIHATTFPFAIVLNLLVMIAVKTKARLQSMSNIALACLASTDVMVGLVVQPLLIAQMVNLIQGETTAGACSVQSATRFFITFFCFSSAVHLFLITVDRYIAIMRPYIYIQTVTKTRVLIATALAWTLSVIVHIVSLIDEELFRTIISVVVVSLVAIIAVCNIIVYREVHRHEKQIAAQQVDVATRENFLSQKRAFKLTLTIIALLVISFLPVIMFRRLKEPLKRIVSFDTLSCIFMAVYSLPAFNSFVNPFIYCIRLRQFRVSFIELDYVFLVVLRHLKLPSYKPCLQHVSFESNRRGKREQQHTNQANVIREVEKSLGGERGEQHANQANVISDIETSLGGEREEQHNSKVNVVRDVEILVFGGKREVEFAKQASVIGDVETSLGGVRKEQHTNQTNVIRDDEKVNVST
ncbi:unnamed protein product [Porites evermanni]|uniref:G-protein coupled receptors family 1 profile domain-containing protein n=1 Tax=Porites evermanni TaxID=104178 RepID=A0ABN8QMH5_9CNID|nr:unnamed protein product [Porites evermanni]